MTTLLEDKATVFRGFCSVIAGNPDIDLKEKACRDIYKPLFGAGDPSWSGMEHGFRHIRAAAEVLLRMEDRGEQSATVDLLNHDMVAYHLGRLRRLGFAGPEVQMKWAIAQSYVDKYNRYQPPGAAAAAAPAAGVPLLPPVPAAAAPPVVPANHPTAPANQAPASATPSAPRPAGPSASRASGASRGSRAPNKRKRRHSDNPDADDEDEDADPSFFPERRSRLALLHTNTRPQANRPSYKEADTDEDGEVEVVGEEVEDEDQGEVEEMEDENEEIGQEEEDEDEGDGGEIKVEDEDEEMEDEDVEMGHVEEGEVDEAEEEHGEEDDADEDNDGENGDDDDGGEARREEPRQEEARRHYFDVVMNREVV